MARTERPGAGFESHWDAAWFATKADEIRALARTSSNPHVVQCLTDLADEFAFESEHAARLEREAGA